MTNGKPRMFKTATIQKQEFLPKNDGNTGKILPKKYEYFWSILPKKVTKDHGWKKGDSLMFIPLEELIEAKPGDVIIRRCNNANRNTNKDDEKRTGDIDN